jgi:hypothetical protein
MSAEDNVEWREVDFGEFGGQVDWPEPRGCLAKSDPGARGKGNDAAGVIGIGDDGAAEPDPATTAYGLPRDSDGADIVCRIEDMECIGHRGGDDLTVFPPASLRSSNGKRGRSDSAAGVAHVGTQDHGVGIDLLVESPAEVPVGNKALRTHQMSEALPVFVGGTVSNVSD